MLAGTAELPSYLVRKEAPAAITVPLPADLIKDSSTRISICCDGGANAVIGEIWLTSEDRSGPHQHSPTDNP